MNTYVIFRRKGWASAKLLERAAARSLRVADQEMSGRIRWIRSYVTEDGGMLGTVCIYQAPDDEAIREHARRAGLPLDEPRAPDFCPSGLELDLHVTAR